ncbi:MAG: methyltransferase domain-containing protein, partial [Candidatus Eisenbacteria bacterium]|nr:methyltransferase domain-containing protein [Candidatus Eisenbacteria bacterium]
MSDPSIEPTGRSLLNSPWPPRDPFLPGPIQWSQLVALRSIILEPQPFCCDPLSGDPYSGDIWRRHGFILLDLRDHAAYEKGHVPGSCHIPAGELPIRRHEIPPKWRPLLLTTDTPDEGSFAVSFFKGTQHRFIRWISEPTSAWPQEMEAGPSRVPSWEIRPCLHHPSLHHPSRAGNTSTAAALDLACGSGRNAVWLALLGWKVLAVDILPEALEMTRNLAARWGAGVTTQAMNLAKEDPLAPDRFDLIVVTRFLERALFPRMTASLKQGGLLIYDTFTEAQAGKGRPHNPRHWLRRNELRAAFPGLSLLDYAEGADTAGDEIAVLIARKPIPDPDHGSIRRAHREGAKMSQETNSHGPTHPSVPIHLIPEAVGRIVLGAFSMTGVNPLAPQDPIHEEIERQ